MGLPIWRDPDEVKIKQEREGSSKPDPTAASRSPIRRRPPQYARRSNPTRRHALPPRFERDPAPSVGFNGLRGGRRGENRTVPPIATLLESADRRRPTPPAAPEPRSRSYVNRSLEALNATERDLGNRIAGLQTRAERLEQEAQRIQSSLVPADWEDRTEEERGVWLEDNGVPRYLYPRDPDAAASTLGLGRFSRSPQPLDRSDRPHSRDGPRRSNLPTPPHDESGDPDSLFLPPHSDEPLRRTRTSRRQHPLSRSWRPDSPVNGLGDRNRSPTPTDGWEIMRTTIAPDETLPSADSSFTSMAVSQSFASNNNSSFASNASTTVTEPDAVSFEDSRRNSADDDSVSSVDPDDLVCSDEEREATAAFAEHMFYQERDSSEGRERIARLTDIVNRDGYRYALFDESDVHEVGFRLIDEALDSSEGRVRVFALAESLPADFRDNFEEWIFGSRRDQREQRTRGAHITDDEPPSPHPERYSSNARAAVRAASEQVHDYFRRFTAEEALTAEEASSTPGGARPVASPPPRYEPLASHPDVNTFTSRDGPEPHPVSPPSARSERDMADALLSGDEQDLQAMRRVVERLAQRDDVPDEWWMSMGLNLSRTRARSRSSSPRRVLAGSGNRIRAGRIERERNASSRL